MLNINNIDNNMYNNKLIPVYFVVDVNSFWHFVANVILGNMANHNTRFIPLFVHLCCCLCTYKIVDIQFSQILCLIARIPFTVFLTVSLSKLYKYNFTGKYK